MLVVCFGIYVQAACCNNTHTHTLTQRCCSAVLQGALLLVLFQASHTLEHILTARAAGDLRALFKGIPESANVLDVDASGEPRMGTQHQELAARVAVGTTILVKPGETVRGPHSSRASSSTAMSTSPAPALLYCGVQHGKKPCS